MTTLGFGDLHAHAWSLPGHILLTFQVLLGYVLLGALVTRFAVLFGAGGPAGKFTPRTKRRRRPGKSGSKTGDSTSARRPPTDAPRRAAADEHDVSKGDADSA